MTANKPTRQYQEALNKMIVDKIETDGALI
jgi:hypothetical protein